MPFRINRNGRSVLIASAAAVLLTTPALAADLPPRAAPAPVFERVDNSFRTAGYYVGVRGGGVFAEDTSFRSGGVWVKNEYENFGLTGSVFGGFQTELFPGFGARLEAELGIASIDVEDHFPGGNRADDPEGDTFVTTGMVNAYVDARLGAFRPFAGVGVGLANVQFNEHGAGGNELMDDDDNAFAYQLSGGVAYDINPNLTLETMVRYQGIPEVELVANDGSRSDADLNSTQVLLGFRYNF